VEVPGRGGGAGPAGKATPPPLPRRVPGMFPAPRRMRALDNVETLRRVLDGLRGLEDGLGTGGRGVPGGPGGPDGPAGDPGGPGGGWPGGRDLA